MFIGLGLVLALPMGPARGESPAPGVTITAIQVQLKVQSVTKENFFMGEVWVAPAKFSDIQIGEHYVGYARASGLDVEGKTVDLSPEWRASDPAMVEVAPNPGQKVKLTVLRAGESDLIATAGSFSKKLVIKAAHRDGAMYVEISQEIINPFQTNPSR
jgi:hypothetical protein